MTVIVPAALARGYHSAPPASAEDVQVVIESFAFQPDSVTVSPGTTVTWVNLDPWIHTVTSDAGAFDSGDLDQNESYSHTFDSIGHYWYHCSRHTSMHGVVIVASETLYDQSDYLGSQASISTDWDDPPNESYDAEAADDFVVPADFTWTIDQVDVWASGSPGPMT